MNLSEIRCKYGVHTAYLRRIRQRIRVVQYVIWADISVNLENVNLVIFEKSRKWDYFGDIELAELQRLALLWVSCLYLSQREYSRHDMLSKIMRDDDVTFCQSQNSKIVL